MSGRSQSVQHMPFEHACFISFSRGSSKDSEFADLFFDEFRASLGALDKRLSVFKFDRCEDRRRGAAWELWIQKELCKSAAMIAICAPNYFTGSPGCVSEFEGMGRLIADRTQALGEASDDWLLGIRLKDTVPMPMLNPYSVVDFLECCASPKRVRTVQKHRLAVERLADRVYSHWQWLNDGKRIASLVANDICRQFTLPPDVPRGADGFPHHGAVR